MSEPLDLLWPRAAGARWLPLGRDQVMLLLAAVSEALSGLDAGLAHHAGTTMRGAAWVPVVFGPLAGAVLLVAGLVAFRRRTLASLLATVVFAASIVVGVSGAWLHLGRTVLPAAPPGQRILLDFFFAAPPVLGPLAFAFIGVFGTSAAWVESPAGSGRLVLPGRLRLQLPYPKTNAYFYVTAAGVLIALVSSVLDHAATGFADAWLWIPTAGGVFAMVVATALGMIEQPTRADLWTYVGAMVLLLAIGALGAALHLRLDLGPGGQIVPERLLEGAPLMAPLLFSNMGIVGLVALLPDHPAPASATIPLAAPAARPSSDG
ncbi:MAG TPA: hypothetical protein VGK30_19695 [Candidatus Binatia bacterium]|jgi:hypothetical protein